MQQSTCLSSCLYSDCVRRETCFKSTLKKQKIKLFLNSPSKPIKLQPWSVNKLSQAKNVSANNRAKNQHYFGKSNSMEKCIKNMESQGKNTQIGKQNSTQSPKQSKRSIEMLNPTQKPRQLNTPCIHLKKQVSLTIQSSKPTVSTIKWKNSLKNIQNTPKLEIPSHPFSRDLFSDLIDTSPTNLNTNTTLGIKPFILYQLREQSEFDSEVSRFAKFNNQQVLYPFSPKIQVYEQLNGLNFELNNAQTISSNESKFRASKQENGLELSEVLARFRRSDLIKNNDNSQELRRKINFSTLTNQRQTTHSLQKLQSVQSRCHDQSQPNQQIYTG